MIYLYRPDPRAEFGPIFGLGLIYLIVQRLHVSLKIQTPLTTYDAAAAIAFASLSRNLNDCSCLPLKLHLVFRLFQNL